MLLKMGLTGDHRALIRTLLVFGRIGNDVIVDTRPLAVNGKHVALTSDSAWLSLGQCCSAKQRLLNYILQHNLEKAITFLIATNESTHVYCDYLIQTMQIKDL